MAIYCSETFCYPPIGAILRSRLECAHCFDPASEALRPYKPILIGMGSKDGPVEQTSSEISPQFEQSVKGCLQSIWGMSELLRESPLDAHQREYTEAIQEAVVQLKQLLSKEEILLKELVLPSVSSTPRRLSLDGKEITILVAEDNPVNQVLIAKLLDGRGYRVWLASNGFEAVRAVHDTNFDLVLMDIYMPELNGLEAMLRIRELEEQRENGNRVPIVAVSSVDLSSADHSLLGADLDAYLVKPFQIKPLLKTIEEVLARYGVIAAPE